MKIRSDLIGVVILTTTEGTTLTLNPGDEVPEGIVVGDHLTAEPEPESENAGDDVADETPAGAADEVPEGVEVGDHLTVAAGEAPDDSNPGDEVPETPKRRTRKR